MVCFRIISHTHKTQQENNSEDKTTAINSVHPTTDDAYTSVDDNLRATFTSFEVTLQAASKEDDAVSGEFLT